MSTPRNAANRTSNTQLDNSPRTPRNPPRAALLRGFAPHDRDEAHALARRPAEVVGEGQLPPAFADRLDGPLRRRLPAELEPGLEQHPQARGADGVAEALEAPVGVHR